MAFLVAAGALLVALLAGTLVAPAAIDDVGCARPDPTTHTRPPWFVLADGTGDGP
jgi:hypothetical protein